MFSFSFYRPGSSKLPKLLLYRQGLAHDCSLPLLGAESGGDHLTACLGTG